MLMPRLVIGRTTKQGTIRSTKRHDAERARGLTQSNVLADTRLLVPEIAIILANNGLSAMRIACESSLIRLGERSDRSRGRV